MLPEGRHVRAVYMDQGGVFGDRAGVGAAHRLLDHRRRDGAHRGAAASARNFAMVDAPVSGGVAGAEAATLTFMVGGPEARSRVPSRCWPAMGKAVDPCRRRRQRSGGEDLQQHDAGHPDDLLCEAMALARRLGCAGAAVRDQPRSSGQCWSLTSYCPARAGAVLAGQS